MYVCICARARVCVYVYIDIDINMYTTCVVVHARVICKLSSAVCNLAESINKFVVFSKLDLFTTPDVFSLLFFFFVHSVIYTVYVTRKRALVKQTG